MKIEVSDASGVVLDWLVAKCEGADNLRRNVHRFNNDWIVDWPRNQEGKTPRVEYLANFSPTHSWAQGGPIIEREQISVDNFKGHPCAAFMGTHAKYEFRQWAPEGQILLVAMRCYVASKLGEEVEVPDELLEE